MNLIISKFDLKKHRVVRIFLVLSKVKSKVSTREPDLYLTIFLSSLDLKLSSHPETFQTPCIIKYYHCLWRLVFWIFSLKYKHVRVDKFSGIKMRQKELCHVGFIIKSYVILYILIEYKLDFTRFYSKKYGLELNSILVSIMKGLKCICTLTNWIDWN